MRDHTTISDFPQQVAERFWKLVTIAGPDDCWLWTGANDGRYGRYYYCDAECVRSSRLAYILTNDSIPEGLEVCHSCDTPKCCNPSHLFAGTHQDNMTDMVNKGRTNAPKGKRQHLARLDEEKVIEIRQMYKTGKYSHLKLAHLFGVSEATIRQVVTRTTWTHI